MNDCLAATHTETTSTNQNNWVVTNKATVKIRRHFRRPQQIDYDDCDTSVKETKSYLHNLNSSNEAEMLGTKTERS